MYMGRVVELADRKSLFNTPRHPYTKALLSAVPSVHTRGPVDRVLISGDPPDAANLPKGCRFASRCPLVQDICRTDDPALSAASPDQHVACHFADTP